MFYLIILSAFNKF